MDVKAMSSFFLKNISKLMSYIKDLEDFRFYNQKEFKKEFFYCNHMGAIITDGVLQAGIKCETVVRPRLKELVKYKKAENTSGFYNLYNQKKLENLINFKGKRKIKTIKDIVELFIKEKIEMPADLKEWFLKDKNTEKLILIYGVGDKTVDYFKILSGISNNAIDRHIINFLLKANIKVENYKEAHNIINKTADYLKINESLLDYSIWKYMSSNAEKRIKSCE